MTRFFYDTEFYENGSTIDLLSFGLVNDTDGAERYWINLDADLGAIPHDHWIVGNVFPHLPVRRSRDGSAWLWDRSHPDAQYLRPRDAIAGELRAFITSYGVSRDMHELWAWYGAYDHVALCQLFGRMVDLPESVPMHTCDLKQLVGNGHAALPVQGGDLHNALADARWVREAWGAVAAGSATGTAVRTFAGAVEFTQDSGDMLLELWSVWRGMPRTFQDDILAKARGTRMASLLARLAA